MRTRTFVISLIVHAAAITAMIVAPIFATAELPEPPRASTFILVTPEVPTIPPPPRQVPERTAQTTAPTNAAPVDEPESIGAERIVEAIDAPIGLDVVGGGGPSTDVLIGAEPAPPVPAVTPPPAPVRVGGVIRPPQKVHHVAPEYPSIARSARVSGIVILEAVISPDGSVGEVRILRSIPLLDEAAIAAVRQWRFTPTLLNGEAVPVIMTVTVAFNLN